MTPGSLLILGSVFIEIINQIQQIRHNKVKKSIYGISFDYYIANFISTGLILLTSYSYRFSSIISQQYKNRYPVHSIIPLNSGIIVEYSVLVILYFAIIWQLYIVYPTTKNINQCFSGLHKLFLTFLFLLFCYVYKLYWYKQETIVGIDVIDSLWFIGQVLSIMKYCPQLMMNWFDDCCIGLHDNWLHLQLVSYILYLIGYWLVQGEVAWYDIPINYMGWTYLCFNCITMIILSLQQFKWYKGHRPKLELYYSAIDTPEESV
ncbi:uncharacterized protein RJT21DRAFT_36563 [Scheffersomyces amazonensis]|uniref:uncharacterized protein n=1 Tax=Scheffersomyces amazonensis TaxID=1078765 RepID=UPI00315DB7C3